jgi:hypothetical protein
MAIPELREIFEPPEEIIQAGLRGDLVFFIGAGASILVGLPSWSGLASLALSDLRRKGIINFSDSSQLSVLDPKKQLSIADSLFRENGLRLELKEYLPVVPEANSIYKYINDIGCPCVTTNYDEQLAPRYVSRFDDSKTPAPVTRVCEKNKFLAKLLNEPGTVVHLHGAVSQPETIIATTKQYLEHYDDPHVQSFLGELFEKKTILFLGYGLEEAEVLEHILRRGKAGGNQTNRRFALQGFFASQTPLYKNLHNYYQHSFGVRLLGFARDHQDYGCLEGIIKSWVHKIEIRKPPLIADSEFLEKVLANE